VMTRRSSSGRWRLGNACVPSWDIVIAEYVN